MSEKDNGSIFQKGIYSLSLWLGIVVAAALCAMMLLNTIDVGGRYFFNKPLFGTYELIGMLLVAAGPLGMALCEKDRSHIVVSILTERLSAKTQAIISSFSYFLSIFTYSIITWQMFSLTLKYIKQGDSGISIDLGIPLFIVAFIFAIGTLMFSLILLLHFVQNLTSLVRR